MKGRVDDVMFCPYQITSTRDRMFKPSFKLSFETQISQHILAVTKEFKTFLKAMNDDGENTRSKVSRSRPAREASVTFVGKASRIYYVTRGVWENEDF